jgi:hypothetical protein
MGMAYWQGGTVADDWSTSYGHFMIGQRKKGICQSISNQMDFISKKEANMAIYAELWK